MNVALRARWAWIARVDPSKPWSGLGVKIGPDAQALFNASVRIELGNGTAVLFWEDPWIGGHTAAAIVPVLFKLVSPAARKRRIVAVGLLHNSWALDISGELSIDATMDYLRLWSAVHAAARPNPAADEADVFRWKWTSDGVFTSRSAYDMLF
jgi:hypothetical protein